MKFTKLFFYESQIYSDYIVILHKPLFYTIFRTISVLDCPKFRVQTSFFQFGRENFFGKKFTKFAKGTSAPVADVVVAEIAESKRIFGCIGGSVDGIAEKPVEFSTYLS